MEQIYTIPVNEAFDAVAENPALGCPFCHLYKKLQEDELDIILGASMMEPDIRIKTNELGFCRDHYEMMLKRKRMLGMGLILESHLDEVEKKILGNGIFAGPKTALESIAKLNSDCYVCSRIDGNMSRMIATAVYLFESDIEFQKKFSKMKYFCLPHYETMLTYASKKMPKKIFKELYDAARNIESKYVKTLRGDVSWFCKKFDYRYDEEPWYNSKDSVKRSIKFLTGEILQDD